MYQRHITGKFGELEVQKYLMQNNYIIIENNFRCRSGEIDIIAAEMQISECEARINSESSVSEREKLRKELHRARVLLNVAAR